MLASDSCALLDREAALPVVSPHRPSKFRVRIKGKPQIARRAKLLVDISSVYSENFDIHARRYDANQSALSFGREQISMRWKVRNGKMK